MAKALSVAQANGPGLTQTGIGIGTPAYIAPEQAIGDPSTDHGADLYSFGCLAYELLAGSPPFHGLPMHQIVAAHMARVPAPVSEGRPDVPELLAALVMRCLQKDPAVRPQSAADVLEVL
ncbi:MAG: protein kinase [Gemmatimonadaceae bacterium]